MFKTVLTHIINILQPFYEEELTYIDKNDTVLINSNFNCGFYINREILYDILRNKYNIQAIYDPCSYPGIQCKFYYNNDLDIQNGMQITTENKDKYKNVIEVSFMIFRTGSVLIVGMCDEYVLQDIYQFLKALLKAEFKSICVKLITAADLALKEKKKKIRRKTINIITGVPEEEIDSDKNLIISKSSPTSFEPSYVMEKPEDVMDKIEFLKVWASDNAPDNISENDYLDWTHDNYSKYYEKSTNVKEKEISKKQRKPRKNNKKVAVELEIVEQT
jgi:hypothetical protein